MGRPAILVFAKIPRPGRVKTRLSPFLTPTQAAAVHQACLCDTVAQVSAVKSADRRLVVAGSRTAARQLAMHLRLGVGWKVDVQGRGGLGERLARWFRWLQAKEAVPVIAVGTDTPWMGSARMARAIALLQQRDAVIGPTADGGYYLVGMRRWLPEIFRNIPWGSNRVVRQTLQRLEESGATYSLLRQDFDLDRPADLVQAAHRLHRRPSDAPALAAILRQLEYFSGSNRRPQPGRRHRKPQPARA